MNWKKPIYHVITLSQLITSLGSTLPRTKTFEERMEEEQFNNVMQNLSGLDTLVAKYDKDLVRVKAKIDKEGWLSPSDKLEYSARYSGELIDTYTFDFLREIIKIKNSDEDLDYIEIFKRARNNIGKISIETKVGDVIDVDRSGWDAYISHGEKYIIKYDRGDMVLSAEILKSTADNNWVETLIFTDFNKLLEGYKQAKEFGIETLTKWNVFNGEWTGKDPVKKWFKWSKQYQAVRRDSYITEFEGKIGKELDYGVVGNVLYKMQVYLENLPKELIDKLAKDHKLSDMDITNILWENLPLTPSTPLPQLNTRNQEITSSKLYSEYLALAVFPILKQLYQNDIKQTVIADRGNRPAWIVLEKIIESLKNDKDLMSNEVLQRVTDNKVKFLKVSNFEQIAEAYAMTDGFASENENYETIRKDVEEVRLARKSFKEARKKNNPNSMQLQDEFKKTRSKLRPFYKEVIGKVKSFYKDHLKGELTQDYDNTAVFDYFIRTGATRGSTVRILKELGYNIASSDFIPMVNTTNNDSGTFAVNPLYAIAHDWKMNTSWREIIEYHGKQLEIGKEYGMDNGTKNVNDLFKGKDVTDIYKLKNPENKVYTIKDIEGVMEDISTKHMVLKEKELYNTYFKDFCNILMWKENSEETQTEVNRLITKMYHDRLDYGVNWAMNIAKSMGKDKLIEYFEDKNDIFGEILMIKNEELRRVA